MRSKNGAGADMNVHALMNAEHLDGILQLQLAVAWAGEANTEPPRLGWWRTSMCDQFGGEDLFRRLAPKTWSWAVLEVARAAAKRVDDRARSRADDPDHLVTLYRLGFKTDEQLDERLLELKQGSVPLGEAFPGFAELYEDWSSERFAAWLGECGEAGYTATATGRRLKGKVPEDLCEAAKNLAAALLPLDREYVLPHFRVAR